MIAFGRPFITNPDLPERITQDWPRSQLRRGSDAARG
nr:hypothetical protein [Acetobacter estunensis]